MHKSINEHLCESWINGSPAFAVPISDRGLAYGDGVFETIRVNETPVLFSQHMSRLMRGLAVLGIPFDRNILEDEISRYLQHRQQGILKIIVTRGVGGRGYASLPNPEPNRILSWHPLPEYPPAYSSEGVSVYACKTVLGQNPSLAGIKHLNRLEQVLARNEWGQENYQEGIVCDLQGNAIEAVFSNLWVVKDGCLMTPWLDMSGVAGVMREWLLEELPKHGVKVKEVTIPSNELLSMDEVFLSNSVFGIWPVKQYNGASWSPGVITMLCQTLVQDLLF